ncbi:hypothetical protein BDF19DRAFT_439303 [Syncephalis fuscata]|nr:hypothetical protein BDF19DRAFT_439303 [Syncephalis fuscata]
MRQMIYPQHEPKRLIVARLSTLATIFGLQIQNMSKLMIFIAFILMPASGIPGILFIGDAALNPRYDILGEALNLDGSQFAWVFLPHKAYFIPTGKRHKRDIQNGDKIFSEIQFTNNADKLRLANETNNLLAIDSLRSSMSSRIQWGTQKVVKIEQFYNKTFGKAGEIKETKYEANADTFNDDPNRIQIILKPSNQPIFHDDTYLIKTMESTPLYWYDVISPVGGALSVALYIFTLLFGQKRLRPWGIVQQFILRNRIFSKVPRAVAVIGSAWSTPKQNPLGHDSAIEHEESEIQHESSVHTVPTLISQQRSANTTIQFAQEPKFIEIATLDHRHANNQIETAMMLGNNQSAQEQSNTHLAPPNNNGAQARDGSSIVDNRASNYNIFTNVRINELEAFRQRVESFYLASDLFERSTLQILTNLNL